MVLTNHISAQPAAQGTPSVTFPISGQQFTITWNEPPLNMGGTVDTYFVNISGPDDLCGNVNTLQRFGSRTRSYACSGWIPAGQKYTFTVQAANCGGDLRGPASDPVIVYLRGMLGKWFVYMIIVVYVNSCCRLLMAKTFVHNRSMCTPLVIAS